MRTKVTLFLSLAGLLASVAPAQQPSMVPYLPAETLMTMSMPDFDASMADFQSMPMAKIWREEEVQNFFQGAREMLQQKIDEAMGQAREMHEQGAMPVDPEMLMKLRVRGMSMAITKLAMQQGDMGPMPTFGVMMHLDFGPTAPQWFNLMQMGMGMLGQTGMMEREEFDVGDAKVIAMKPVTAPDGLEMGLNVAMLKDGVILGTLLDDVRGTVERMQKGEAALGATDDYKSMVQRTNADGADMQMFMRPSAMMDFGLSALSMAAEFEPDMAMVDVEGVGRAMDALGMRSMRWMAVSSRYEDGKCVTTSFVNAPAPERKGFFAGGDKAVDMEFLKWVPQDAVSFSAMTMEPMSLYDAITGAVRAYSPDMAEMVMAQLGQMEEKVGFNLRDDLFGAIGDSMITWSMPMASITAPPEMAVLVKVNDEQKVVKVLKSLCAMSGGDLELEEAEKRGVKSYQLRVNIDPTEGMGMNPLEAINPSFAFNKGYMVLGFSASDIRRVFQRMDRTDDDGKKDIRNNKEFADYVATLPKSAQSISFTDWKATFESYYQIVSSLLAFLPPSEDLPLDMQMLPDSSTMTKHLFGSLTYATADAEGFTSKSTSPMGPEVVAALVAGVAVGVAVASSMQGGF